MRPLLLAALVSAFGLSSQAAPGPSATPPEVGVGAIVRARLVQDVLRKKSDPSSADKSLAAQRDDGSWPDIPYANRDRSLWAPVRHLERLAVLAAAWRDPASPARGDPRLLRGIIRGLEFWLTRDPTSDNWWWNTIGLQQGLAPVLILARDDLPPDEFRRAALLLHRSHVDGMTGTNLVWEAGNLFTLGALTDDTPLMTRMLGLITREIAVTTKEGVQPDWSFHQHGPQLNAGNYGLSFLESGGRYAALVQGTSLQFPPEKLAVLTGFAINFQDWVVWGQAMDLSSCGRQLDLPNAQTRKAADLASDGARLAALDPASAPALTALVRRVSGQLPPAADAPVGDRYFWRSDFLVHRPGNWYASIKMFSPRVLRTETKINNENYKGYHLCDGVTMLLVRGDEYENLQPVWDWRKLPGVTFKETAAPFPYGSKLAATEHNPNPFVGGVSDGAVGVAVLDLTKEDVRAQKAWFCFGEGVVCLGAGIASASPETVTTDLNQCRLRGAVQLLVGGTWSDAPAGRTESSVLQAVRHDNVGYVFLAPARAVVTAGPQRGSWAELRKEGVTNRTVTAEVFNLWIDHGPRAAAATYAYVLLPRAGADAVARFAAEPAYRILANTPALQAVAAPAEGLVGAVFHARGRLAAAAGLQLTADAPCVVLARRLTHGLALSVADPTQLRRTLRLTLGGRYAGSSRCHPAASGQGTEIEFDLAQGPAAGSTEVETLTALPP